MPRSLADWLGYIETQHAQPIALGLERVAQVLARMGTQLACPVFTVGGTNGKGSTSAMLEAVLRAAGYRTGLYSSPHLLRYNERVRIAGRDASDEALVAGFEAVERARDGVPLTYFEYGTLAALQLFVQARLDAVILEVGLGGRLDAVNVVDTDCAVLTSVAIDHVDYLGSTREAIGREKAGIFRSGRPAVVADPDPPASVLDAAARRGAQLLRYGHDFGCRRHDAQWDYWGPAGRRAGLAHPALRGRMQLRNAAAALCALDCLRGRLPVAMHEVRRGLADVTLRARFEVVPGRPQVVLDVAHNAEAAALLAENLAAGGYAAEAIAVFGMLRDKDIAAVLRALAARITRWHCAPLAGARGAGAQQLERGFELAGIDRPRTMHASIEAAFGAARSEAHEDDKIIVFGSFLTVSAVLALLESKNSGPGHGHG
jgi:dihydrofolate synthase/folylpolyglutamate synthase